MICTCNAMQIILQPIFYCDAKPFALGTDVGLDPQCHTFASPNTKDTNLLVSFALSDANFSRHPMQNPNASQWNIGCVGFQTQNFRVGHVHFMFFVLISFAFGGQQTQFPVEYGLTCIGFCGSNQPNAIYFPNAAHQTHGGI